METCQPTLRPGGTSSDRKRKLAKERGLRKASDEEARRDVRLGTERRLASLYTPFFLGEVDGG